MERKQNSRSHVVTKNDQGEEGIKMVPRRWQEEASRIFRKLPKEQAFCFFTSVGNYTGESAASFEEFLEKIKEIEIKSLEFHLCRGDFEKWIAEILEDKELAEEILNLRDIMPTRDVLRKRLVTIVSKRREKLVSEEVVE
jgi:hypothetical protein